MRVLASTSIPSGTENLISGFTNYLDLLQFDMLLSCRGYKIPVIENLGTTMDQFDCIDFSDNEIR